MVITSWPGRVSIELDMDEAADLAEFLGQFFEGSESVVDHLSAELDDIVQRQEEAR